MRLPGEESEVFWLLTNISTLHRILWSLKCKTLPDKTVWQEDVYNSVHPDSLWRLCLLLLGHVSVWAWVKATGFSHLLPLRGAEAERKVHLIIGLSASVVMLEFRFCPAHTPETAVHVCVCGRLVSDSYEKDRTKGELEGCVKWCGLWEEPKQTKSSTNLSALMPLKQIQSQLCWCIGPKFTSLFVLVHNGFYLLWLKILWTCVNTDRAVAIFSV